jgi:ABC-type multidrug transport system fused ATPase/permease subunit
MLTNNSVNYFRNNLSTSIIFLFMIMFVGAFFEIIGIGLFIPLLANNEDSDFIQIIKKLFDFFNFDFNNINIAICIIMIFLIKFLFVNIQNLYIYRVSYQFMYDIKVSLMNKLYNVTYISFLELGVDSLNNIFTKEIEKKLIINKIFFAVFN